MESNEAHLNFLASLVTNHVTAMLAYWDKDLICRFANEAYCNWFGKTPAEMIDHITIRELLGPIYTLNEGYIQGALNGEIQTFEREIPGPDGKIRYGLANYFPHTVEGKTLGFVAHVADITYHKHSETEKRRVEEILEKSNRIAKIGTWEVDMRTGEAHWSSMAREIFEVAEGFRPGMWTVVEFLTPSEHSEEAMATIAHASATGKSCDFEAEITTAKGNRKWIRIISEAEFEKGECIRRFGIFQDITKSKITEEELKSKANFIDALNENVPCLIYVHDRRTAKLTYMNQYAQDILGYDMAEINAVPGGLFSLFHPEDQARLGAAKGIRDSGGMHKVHLEFRIRTKAGNYIWLSLTDAGFKFDNNGVVLENLGAGIEITERREMENALRKAKEEAEEANRVKSEFLSVISHEIRTPMNSVIGFTELLAEGNPRPDQKEYLDIVQFSTRHLLSLINDVLDYSRIESGKIVFESRPLDLRFHLDQLVQLFATQASEKGIVLSLKLPEKPIRNLLGDELRLNQIVSNLLSNAVKFTEKGAITLGFELLRSEANKKWISIKVSDTGIGIPENKLQSIFESFIQADASTSRKFGGTRLGLSITKKLVEMQGGEVHVKSQVGVGTVFEVVMPFLLSGDDQDGPYLEQEPEVMDLKGIKVLLAEDNKMNVLLATRIIEKWNCTVDVAWNGFEALGKLSTAKYDLVLMDLQMPEMDGFEAVAQIRQSHDPHIANIPIIALTASLPGEMIKNPLYKGFNGYITKPFEVKKLYHTLANYVG